MKMIKGLSLFFLLGFTTAVHSQRLAGFEWLEGQWEGEAFGGQVFEYWNSGQGGEMIGTFQMVNKGKSSIIELMVIRKSEDTTEMFFNHFNDDLSRWEDAPIKFGLERLTKNEFIFRNMIEGKTAPRSLKYTFDPGKNSLVVVVEEWEKTSAGYESFSVIYQKK